MVAYRIKGCYATQQPLECSDKPQGKDMVYSGPNLPGTGINTCDSLDEALQKIDAAILELKTALLNNSLP